MKLTVAIAVALAGAAVAQNSTSSSGTTAAPSTTVVSALTTVCGSATVLTQNGNYYTCTEAMTITITDCPCTMTQQPPPQTYASPPSTTPSTTTIIVSNTCVSPPPTVQDGQPTQPGYTSPALCPNANVAPAGPGGQPTYPAGVAPGTTMVPSTTQHGGYAYTNSAAARSGASIRNLIALLASGAVYALIM